MFECHNFALEQLQPKFNLASELVWVDFLRELVNHTLVSILLSTRNCVQHQIYVPQKGRNSDLKVCLFQKFDLC